MPSHSLAAGLPGRMAAHAPPSLTQASSLSRRGLGPAPSHWRQLSRAQSRRSNLRVTAAQAPRSDPAQDSPTTDPLSGEGSSPNLSSEGQLHGNGAATGENGAASNSGTRSAVVVRNGAASTLVTNGSFAASVKNGAAATTVTNGAASKIGGTTSRSNTLATRGKSSSSKSSRSSSSSFVLGKEPDVPPSVLDYFKATSDLEGLTQGPPRFFCPLEARPRAAAEEVLPRLFFVPGIEGTGFGLCLHHKSLSRLFEVSCLNVPLEDRTSFLGLVELVEAALKEEHAANPGRALFLMGESFGGTVSLAVAERNPGLPLTLVLVNPATSFERSEFQPLIPFIPFIPDALYPALPALLSFSLGNPVKMASSGIDLRADPFQKAMEIRDNLLKMIPTLPEVARLLPKATLEWKLKLLADGTTYIESRLPDIACPTLILASGDDKLVPSAEEGKRLKELMKGSKVRLRTFRDSGHTLLLEGDFDVARVIKGSGVYRRTSKPKESFYLESFPSPTNEDVAFARTSGSDGLIRFLSSPVFLSTQPDGTIVQGLGGFPSQHRPLLFVGNHQTYAPDLPVMVGEVLERTGVLMRGLAHPMAMGEFGGESADTGMSDTFRLFGAVPVTGTAAYRLLANGEAVLLFPGGAREALKGRGEEYKLFWPDKEEFVRLAAKFNATIVPFAAIGVDDGYNYVLDGQELLENPFLGPRIKEFLKTVPVVRDESFGPAKETFSPPVVLPKSISRLYFLFQKPIPTEGLGQALKDREQASEMYRHVRQEVEDGLEYLLRKREEDPYKDLFTRLAYEASWGGKRQAPTFSP